MLRATAAVHGGTRRVDVHTRLGHAPRLMQQQSEAENDRRFRLLVESVEDYAIFILSLDGFVATWNAGAQRIKR